jgi:hypothetical protein
MAAHERRRATCRLLLADFVTEVSLFLTSPLSLCCRFTIDPKEKLLAIQLTQGATARVQSRHLFKNLVYGALVE